MQIYFNEFTEIPKEFGNLPKSGVYMMQHNKFAGEVPETCGFMKIVMNQAVLVASI